MCPPFVNTGKFSGVQCSAIMPMFNQFWVADRIVQGIKQKEVEVTIPWWYGGLTHLARAFGFQDKITSLVLNLNAMDKFRGRLGPKAPLALTGKV